MAFKAPDLSQEDLTTLTAKLTLAQEAQLLNSRGESEVDFLIYNAQCKQEVRTALDKAPGKGKRVAAFRAVLEHLRGTPGFTRLSTANDATLEAFLLRFKPAHKTSVEGKPWKFTLAKAATADADCSTALAEMYQKGGNQSVQLKRPLTHMGKLACAIEEKVYPERAQKRANEALERKGKGKGSGGRGKEVPSAASAVPAFPGTFPAAPGTNTEPSAGATYAAPAGPSLLAPVESLPKNEPGTASGHPAATAPAPGSPGVRTSRQRSNSRTPARGREPSPSAAPQGSG